MLFAAASVGLPFFCCIILSKLRSRCFRLQQWGEEKAKKRLGDEEKKDDIKAMFLYVNSSLERLT